MAIINLLHISGMSAMSINEINFLKGSNIILFGVVYFVAVSRRFVEVETGKPFLISNLR